MNHSLYQTDAVTDADVADAIFHAYPPEDIFGISIDVTPKMQAHWRSSDSLHEDDGSIEVCEPLFR